MSENDSEEKRPSPVSATLPVSELLVTRLSYDGWDLPPAAPNPAAEAFGLIIQLKDFRHHKLWRNNKLVYEGGHVAHTTAITDLRDVWQCHHLSPFDNLRFRLPFSYLRAFADDVGRPEFSGLTCPNGHQDRVLYGLALALLPALQDPKRASKLFLDQIALAITTHITQVYGGLHFAADRKGTLAKWQEKRATDFLSSHLDGQFSVTQLAQACDLSRSYFTKAFRETFGKTPYRWLTEYRVVRAQQLLMTEAPIAEIAVACGFTDQSHLTRVFSEITGESPGNWRRLNRRSVTQPT